MVAAELVHIPQSLEEFKNWEFEDGKKYEWFDGEVVKFDGMQKREYYIYMNLLRFFSSKNLLKIGGLVAEQNVDFSPIQMRRPDIAYFSKEQELRMKEGNDEVPAFAIEIISKNDVLNAVEKKLEEYFKYGVKVVWLILPELKKVKVYTSLNETKNCYGNDVCSAAPILPTFEMTVNEIFD